MVIETTKLYILILAWMTFIFIQGHNCIRNQNFGVQFLANLSTDFDKTWCVARTCWIV